LTMIHHELEHARVSTKKLKKIAAEQNENLCADHTPWCPNRQA
jgi:hypothetical protein